MGARTGFIAIAAVALIARGAATVACGGSTPAPKACDQACIDGVAARSMREAMKLAFNLLLQGREVGPQDAMGPCPLGGKVHVFGTATSNADQGSTMVDLTYEFDACGYSVKNGRAEETYSMTLTGTAKEVGTISVQPSSTTALTISSDSMTLKGTVYDPPTPYEGDACKVTLGQSGNNLAGKLCDRDVGVSL